MRILHVTDIHCNLDNLEEIIEREHGSYDLVAITGDICCDSRLTRILRSAGAKVFAVTGNMDDTHIARILRDNDWLLDGRVAVIGDVVLAGVGGLQPIQDIERLRALLPRTLTPRHKLLVLAHHPIHGHLDKTFMGVHAGLYEARRFVEEFKPLVYMHGHIHEARGIDRYGETLLVNPGPAAQGYYALVVVEDGEAKAELRSL